MASSTGDKVMAQDMSKDKEDPNRKAIARALDTGLCSDMQIICGAETFNAHKVVVCLRSSFFYNAFFTSGMVEQKTGIMTLGHKEPTVVKAMLEYLYKRDYVEVTDEPRDDESEPGVTQAPVPQVPSKEDKEKGKQVKSVQEPDGDVAESVDSLYEDVDDDPNGKELWNGPLTFNMRVYALATEYFIDDLKSFAIGKIKACINETSNDDFCKAVMVMHQDVPAEETELYDHIATAAAAHIVDLKGSASSEYLVKYHARVLLEVAVKAASVNGGVGRTSFLRISLVPKTPSWRCQFCTSIKHNRRCLSCHGIDRTEAWA